MKLTPIPGSQLWLLLWITWDTFTSCGSPTAFISEGRGGYRVYFKCPGNSDTQPWLATTDTHGSRLVLTCKSLYFIHGSKLGILTAALALTCFLPFLNHGVFVNHSSDVQSQREKTDPAAQNHLEAKAQIVGTAFHTSLVPVSSRG